MVKINFANLISNNVDERTVSTYIDFYFHNMLGLRSTKEIYYKKYGDGYISIMKDEMDRKNKGTGKFRERPWSNFLFYFIHTNDFKAAFGNNLLHRDIQSISGDGQILLGDKARKIFARNPNGLYLNQNNNYKLAKHIFEKNKSEKSFLFVRAYVYITIVLYDDGNASTSNYLTYYYNTNYKFTETVQKKNFISNVAYSYLVEDLDNELYLISDNNKDVFDCVKAYNNTIDYTNQTSKNLQNVTKAIEDKNEYVIVEGSARTGKTILAMSLLGRYPESHLLVMNYYFYLALKDAFAIFDTKFPYERIFHSNSTKKGYYNGVPRMNFDFSIIDECQRLGEEYGNVKRILSSPTHKHTVFLGDNLQRLKKGRDDGIEHIKETLLNNGKQVSVFRFTSSVGIPPEVLKNVKYLLNDKTVLNPHYLGGYNINLFDTKEEFLSEYKNDIHKSKHLTTIQEPEYDFTPIGEYLSFFKVIGGQTEYPFYLNKEVIDKYYLSPYELISREVECIYVYLRNNVNSGNIKDFVFTQLYVLMTRGTVSLNIFCENNELRNSLRKKINTIKNYTQLFGDENEIMKSGQFEVDESLLDSVYQKYNLNSPRDEIKERCITRLVHFTPEANVKNILENGILPRKDLENKNSDFEFNDENRWDNHPESICLSVENPNWYLLRSFKSRYPERKYKLLIINPSILYSSFVNENGKVKLTPREYCNYNAAARSVCKSSTDLGIMFSENVQTQWGTFSRGDKESNIPTNDQAEILFSGRISPEYIESIEEI